MWHRKKRSHKQIKQANKQNKKKTKEWETNYFYPSSYVITDAGNATEAMCQRTDDS